MNTFDDSLYWIFKDWSECLCSEEREKYSVMTNSEIVDCFYGSSIGRKQVNSILCENYIPHAPNIMRTKMWMSGINPYLTKTGFKPTHSSLCDTVEMISVRRVMSGQGNGSLEKPHDLNGLWPWVVQPLTWYNKNMCICRQIIAKTKYCFILISFFH